MTTTVDLLLCLEETLHVLHQRGWTNSGTGTPDGDGLVSLTTAIEVATDGRAGGVVSEAYKATVIAAATKIVIEAQRAGRPAPVAAWCMRQAEPSWCAAEQLLEFWDGASERTWHDVANVLELLIEEVGAEESDAEMTP